jgi:nitrate/TMAO reductase-like tetraheme cytochrome c subunit
MSKSLKLLLWPGFTIGFLLGLMVLPGVEMGNRLTSTDNFCGNSCHAMKHISDDPVYLSSSHRANASGVIAQCKDCHLPQGLIAETQAHIVNGTRDLLASITHDFSDPEIWQIRRVALAHEVREAFMDNDSAACKTCHLIEKQLAARPRVQRQHELAQNNDLTCIQCHYNLVHSPVEPSEAFKVARQIMPDYNRVSPDTHLPDQK